MGGLGPALRVSGGGAAVAPRHLDELRRSSAGGSGPGPHGLLPLAPAEIHENVISPVDVSRVKEDALQVGHAELKDKLRDISQGFDRLRRVSHQGYGDQAGEPRPAPRCPAPGRRQQSPCSPSAPRATPGLLSPSWKVHAPLF